MVNVKSDSDTRTHELEGVDIDNDPSKASETCVGVRASASGTLVPHHESLTFTNFFPLENTGSIVPVY